MIDPVSRWTRPSMARRLVLLFVVGALVAGACGNRRPESEDVLASLLEGTDGAADISSGSATRTSRAGADAGSADAGSADAGSSGTSTGGAASAGGGEAPVGTESGDGDASAGASAAATGSESSAASADLGPPQYDQGASDSEIVFASVSSLTGLFNDYFQPAAARAYFKYINSQGGINGRQLKLIIYDDQWDASRHGALVRQANESDGIFAFVAMEGILSEQGGVAYIDEHKIPVIGGEEGNAATWGKSPMYFSITNLGIVTAGRVLAHYALDTVGCQAIAGVSLAVEESRGFLENFLQGMNDRGMQDYVYRRDVGFAEVDYTSYVLQARDEGADCVVFGGAASTFVRWRRAAAQQGYDAPLLLPLAGYDNIFLEGAEGLNEGDIMEVPHALIEDADTNPAMAEYVEQVQRFEPNVRYQSSWAVKAWISAKAATEAVRRMGNNLTRTNLLEALHSFENFDTGMSPPISWDPGPHPGSPCDNIATIRNGEFVLLEENLCL